MPAPKTCIAIMSICAPALWLWGCAPTVPRRLPAMPSLVLMGELDPSVGFDRNDGALGLDRDPVSRSTIGSVAATLDRQWITNGRPYSDYRFTTRTAERLRR